MSIVCLYALICDIVSLMTILRKEQLNFTDVKRIVKRHDIGNTSMSIFESNVKSHMCYS